MRSWVWDSGAAAGSRLKKPILTPKCTDCSAVQSQPGNEAYKFLEQVHVTGAKGGKVVQVTFTFDVNSDRPIECRKIFFSQSKSIAIQKKKGDCKIRESGERDVFWVLTTGFSSLKHYHWNFVTVANSPCELVDKTIFLTTAILLLKLLYQNQCVFNLVLFMLLLLEDYYLVIFFVFSRANQISARWPLFADVDVQIAAVLASLCVYRVHLYFKWPFQVCVCVYFS